MTEVNRVPFRYEPVNGDLYLDHFRQSFFMERLEDVRETLQYLCFAYGVAQEIEGELFFADEEGRPPEILDIRYPPVVRGGDGFERPFPDPDVTLWEDD